jgi:hypothetical protein
VTVQVDEAVLTLLDDAEWVLWSDHEVARRCAVDSSTVDKDRASLPLNGSENTARTYKTKHGTEATMHTENSGRGRAAARVVISGARWRRSSRLCPLSGRPPERIDEATP